MVNQQFLRQRYDLFILKWATSWENLFLLYVNNKSADQPAHPCSLISVFVIRCLDSNKLLQLKAIRIIHCISNLSVCPYMYICLILSFALQARCSVVRGCVCVCINIFKHLLFWNYWDDWSQISCGASLGWGNKGLFKRSRSHDQDGRNVHIWGSGWGGLEFSNQ